MKNNTIQPKVKIVFDRKNIATSSTAKDKKKGLVQIEIYWNRKRKYISTGVYVYTNQWSENGLHHVVASSNAQEYNKTIQNAIDYIYEKIQDSSQYGTYDNLFTDNFFDIGSEILLEDYMMKVFDSFVVSPNTHNTYIFKTHAVARYGKFPPLKQIKQSDLHKFEMYLINERKNKQSTIHQIMSGLNQVFNQAMSDGIIKQNPMEFFRTPRGKSKERIYLTEEWIKKIKNAKLNTRFVKSRDMFLFQCYTGISYIDLETLNKSMFSHENGSWYLTRKRQKTSIRYRIMILKPALEIIKRYDFSFGKINRFTYLNQIEKIGTIIGYPFKLTSHVGRHTFATWALSNGVPIEIVSKMLGHTNINTTQIYAKILAKDVEAQFKKLDQLF